LELVVDKDRAVAWIKGEADKLYFEKLDELKAFMNGAFDLGRLLELAKIMGDFKVRIVSMMNDFLSGQADDDLKTELENFINSLYQKAKEARDRLLTNKPFEVVIEGQTVSFPIAKEMVGAFVQFIERYLLEHPAPTPVPVPIPDPWQPIIYREVAHNRPLTVVTTEYDSKYIQLPKYDYRVPIWSPIPDFDPNHHLTEFGVLTLFARLVVKYGEFVFTQDANGNYTFNMDLFSNELTKTDEDRAVRRLERLLGKELPAMQDFINSLKDSDGALPIDKINLISEKYLELKEKILILASDAQNKAQKVWAKFMEVYESNLFKGLLSMQVDGKRITFEPKVLDEILMRLHQKGKLDPEFLKKFDEMIKGGESTWEYDEFKYLRTYYDWWLERSWGGDIWGISFTEQTVENPELSTTAGTFTLGDLLMLPGISRKDLSGGLDVAEKDGRLILTPVDPIKLLGLLDMRALAPGSGVNVGGLMTKANSEDAVMSVFGRIDYVLPFRGNKLDWKSFCFKAFELIPAMIKEMGIKVIGNDGKVNVESFEKKALRFERVNLPPSTTLTTADITELPGNPRIARVAPEGNSSGVSSTSRGVELFYDTNVGGWAGGGFTFDDFGTYDIETVDLSGFTQLVFGLKGGTDKVKFEIVDGDDHKASAELSGILPDQEQVWTIPTSMLQGVNLTKVRLIYF
ncbi:MAG: hypothetical protein HYZ67_08415, partial [Chlamydiae bacterium]|nr:hypothetical protein [Chlamydiota bacterium]